MINIILYIIKINKHCTIKMLSTFIRVETKAKLSNNYKTIKKQVKFGYVESRYYQRKPGCITYKPGIKLGAEYEPF